MLNYFSQKTIHLFDEWDDLDKVGNVVIDLFNKILFFAIILCVIFGVVCVIFHIILSKRNASDPKKLEKHKNALAWCLKADGILLVVMVLSRIFLGILRTRAHF